MTDKEQIIINGVDVSKCDKLIVNQLYGYACNCEEDTHIISSCKNRHNCYYKQLPRKTTECEELKKGYAELTKIVSPYMDDFTGYNEELGGFDPILCVKELFQQLAHKMQECEKLKNQVDEDYNYYTTELKTLRDIISNKEKRNAALFLTSGRYLKALEPFEDEYFKGLDTKQIAELAKKSIRLTTENRKLENKLSDIAGICSQILDGEDYVRRIAKTILDIID